ncbi:alpha/beta hydrolase fold domain-containing protein [Eggerthellaceae bacterium zg-893]|nr:alpha/beta hydrolase fold domain-containing protein [Eggerthellaceae bacterium zg-893]
MALSKAALAAVRAITRLRPGIGDSYLRQRSAEDMSARLVVVNPRCRLDDLVAPVRDGCQVPVRVFTPLDVNLSLKRGLHVSEDFRGTILFFHGGGWANGDVAFYTESCMRTALRLERRVVSVDYRRSPEHRFPVSLHDCYDVAKALFAGEILTDVRPDRIVLAGDSAGGNLAAAVSLMARDSGEFDPRAQILLYPLVYNDHSESTIFDSVRENGEDYLLTRQAIQDYVHMYLSSPADRDNPYFAPLLSPDLSRQPRTLVITAEYDPLRDEGEAYAARLEADGSDVDCYRMLDGIHGYFLYPMTFGLVRDTYAILANFLDGAALPSKESDKAWIHLLGTD